MRRSFKDCELGKTKGKRELLVYDGNETSQRHARVFGSGMDVTLRFEPQKYVVHFLTHVWEAD